MYSKCYHAVNRRIVSFLFCLPFANRASDSGDLYIDFNRNHLIFPVAYLVSQVDALFIIFPSRARISIAYHIPHIMPCIASCCLCIASWFIVVPLLVFLLWVEPGDEYVIEETVEYGTRIKLSTTLRTLQARWPYPRYHFYLCFASCSLFCHAPLPITCYIMSPIFRHVSL